jgi:ribosomal protein S18 acetylase RimI-like enzyme
MPVWRAMARDDLDFVLDLAAQLYPDHPETQAAFASKLDAAPEACFVATRRTERVGYCVALWTQAGRPPKLDEAGYIAVPPLSLHLHDIAIDPRARGLGLVGSALARLVSVAKGAKLSLVAVNGTRALWERYGFAPAAIDETVRATYGEDAVYMERR